VNELAVEVDPAEVGLEVDQEADLTVSFFTQPLPSSTTRSARSCVSSSIRP
jgi:hypothetical protein